jgi:hypothetical protein
LWLRRGGGPKGKANDGGVEVGNTRPMLHMEETIKWSAFGLLQPSFGGFGSIDEDITLVSLFPRN